MITRYYILVSQQAYGVITIIAEHVTEDLDKHVAMYKDFRKIFKGTNKQITVSESTE